MCRNLLRAADFERVFSCRDVASYVSTNKFLLLMCTLALALTAPALWSQTNSQSSTPPTQQQPTQQAPPPEAGGPQGEISPIVVPKKQEAPPEPPPHSVKNPAGMPDYSLHVDVPLVSVPVTITTKDGEFIPGLKKDNFKILENGVPQTITNFSQSGDAPITAVMLVEFAANNYNFIYDMLNNAYGFASSLKKNDWVAVISYDMRPEIQQDFTQDKMAVVGALNHLRIPGFSETNEFDALYDTLDRLERVPGQRKYIVLISTGLDTFSKLTFDKILKKVKNTKDVTIFAISTGQLFREYLDSHGALPAASVFGPGRLDFLQGDNELNTFAKLTGGKAYFPRFEGQVPEVVADISNAIRNQYDLSYHSTDSKQDGTYRKIKVELVDAQTGGPINLHVNGKSAKYNVVAREGYTAKHEVE